MDHFRRSRQQIPVTLPDGQDIANLFGAGDLVADGIEKRQVHDSVRKMVEELPEEQREVIVLRMYSDLSFEGNFRPHRREHQYRIGPYALRPHQYAQNDYRQPDGAALIASMQKSQSTIGLSRLIAALLAQDYYFPQHLHHL
jgi:hypothetical protein